jgi:capsule polysaccharide export protein KpsE/RkpR
VVVLALAIVHAFFLAKKEYSTQISFLPSTEGSSNVLSLMGISLPSLTGGSIINEQIPIVFESNGIKRRILEEFNFYRMFKLTKKKAKYELGSKLLKEYVMFQTKEKGALGFEKILGYTITCFHPSPDSAKMLCDFAYSLLDSAIQSISVRRAHRNRLFIEDQLQLYKQKLDSLQKVFQDFQIANKTFIAPDQIKLALKNYADIKSAAILNDLKIKALQKEFQGNLPEIEELEKNGAVYNQKLSQIESSSVPDVLPSLGLSAKLGPLYANLLRDIEVYNQVILLFSRELEDARIQEAKNVSSLVVIDHPYVPQYKTRPKRLQVMGVDILIEHFLIFLFFGFQFYFSNVLIKNERVRLLLQEMKKAS